MKRLSKRLRLKTTLRRYLNSLIFFTGLVMLPGYFSGANAQVVQQKIPAKVRLLFLLDGSYSMLSRWENTNRITAAKYLLSKLVDSLQVNNDVEIALRAYGHQYHKSQQVCEDTKLEVPFGKNNHEAILQKIKTIKPKGTTPIAYALEQAGNDFTRDPNYRNIIIIITDGIEACDGDPCAVSLALQKKNIFLRPFVIGIGMNKVFEEQFNCLGRFYEATNIRDFKKALDETLTQSLEDATLTVELLDHKKRPVETNVNITFVNNFTSLPQFDFVHYLDRKGHPDTIRVDPVLNYDVIVNTVPPVIKKDLQLKAGRHNVIRIQCPRSPLIVNLPNSYEYGQKIQYLVKRPGTDETLAHYNVNESYELLLGKYDIELLTLPRVYLKDVTLNPEGLKSIDIPGPGVVNVVASFRGYGSLYQLDNEGWQRWVYNLDEKQSRHTFALQPGRYKMVFRSEQSLGSKYTQIKDFTLKTGETFNINFKY